MSRPNNFVALVIRQKLHIVSIPTTLFLMAKDAGKTKLTESVNPAPADGVAAPPTQPAELPPSLIGLNGRILKAPRRPSRPLRTRPSKQVIGERVRRLVEILADNPDKTLQKAGEEAGYPAGGAESQACQALKSPSAQELFRRAMARVNELRPDALVEKLAQGLTATQTKFFAHEGQVVDERECVDYGTRLSYLSLAAKLSGADPATRMELTGANGKDLNAPVQQTIVVLPQLTTEQLLALIDLKEPLDVPVVPVVPVAAPIVADVGEDIGNGDGSQTDA